MPVTALWWEAIIQIPKSYLTATANPFVFDLDMVQLWLDLRALEWSIDGMGWPQMVVNDTPRVYAGFFSPRGFNILNPWRVQFEDGEYAVNCVGANNNLLDVRIWNTVSVQPNNAAARQARFEDIKDAVWDADRDDHTIAGSMGRKLGRRLELAVEDPTTIRETD